MGENLRMNQHVDIRGTNVNAGWTVKFWWLISVRTVHTIKLTSHCLTAIHRFSRWRCYIWLFNSNYSCPIRWYSHNYCLYFRIRTYGYVGHQRQYICGSPTRCFHNLVCLVWSSFGHYVPVYNKSSLLNLARQLTIHVNHLRMYVEKIHWWRHTVCTL